MEPFLPGWDAESGMLLFPPPDPQDCSWVTKETLFGISVVVNVAELCGYSSEWANMITTTSL